MSKRPPIPNRKPQVNRSASIDLAKNQNDYSGLMICNTNQKKAASPWVIHPHTFKS